MTAAEFLAWETHQAVKWEFDGIRPRQMNGGTRAHSIIGINIVSELLARLPVDGPCQVYATELKIATGRTYRYPDAVISCTSFANSDRIVPDPVVIFEILSDSTGSYDRTIKLAEYQSLPSVCQCILVEQDYPYVTVVSRSGVGWSMAVLGSRDEVLLAGVGISVPVATFYDRLSFPEAPEAAKQDA